MHFSTIALVGFLAHLTSAYPAYHHARQDGNKTEAGFSLSAAVGTLSRTNVVSCATDLIEASAEAIASVASRRQNKTDRAGFKLPQSCAKLGKGGRIKLPVGVNFDRVQGEEGAPNTIKVSVRPLSPSHNATAAEKSISGEVEKVAAMDTQEDAECTPVYTTTKTEVGGARRPRRFRKSKKPKTNSNGNSGRYQGPRKHTVPESLPSKPTPRSAVDPDHPAAVTSASVAKPTFTLPLQKPRPCCTANDDDNESTATFRGNEKRPSAARLRKLPAPTATAAATAMKTKENASYKDRVQDLIRLWQEPDVPGQEREAVAADKLHWALVEPKQTESHSRVPWAEARPEDVVDVDDANAASEANVDDNSKISKPAVDASEPRKVAARPSDASFQESAGFEAPAKIETDRHGVTWQVRPAVPVRERAPGKAENTSKLDEIKAELGARRLGKPVGFPKKVEAVEVVSSDTIKSPKPSSANHRDERL